ncbi:MAG: UV DNA damage repair endonuclease UvsE [Clostridium baratii]
MNIGYACTPLKIHNKTTRTFTLKNYTEDKLIECIKYNLEDLYEILKYNLSNDIYMFRISSDIIPFGSHEINKLDWSSIFKEDFKKINDIISKNSIRISMHPGQYTVLNSKNLNTVEKSISDLEYHAKFLDSISNDKSNKIILHIGGVYDNKKESINRFLNVYNSLSKNIKDRLVIENDEKNYSIKDLLTINEHVQIPIIYDNLHYLCYEGVDTDSFKILNSIKDTWNKDDGKIKVHYSQQAFNKRIGSHSNTIFIDKFLEYLKYIKNFDIDIMLEVKDKDFSSTKIVNVLKELNNTLDESNKLSALKTYEFYLKERDLGLYKEGKYILYENGIIEFYKFIDKCSSININETLSFKALKEFYLYTENSLSKSEIAHLNKLFKTNDILKTKDYIIKISRRNKLDDNLKNYFLHNI